MVVCVTWICSNSWQLYELAMSTMPWGPQVMSTALLSSVDSLLQLLLWSQSISWSSSFPAAFYFSQHHCLFQRTLPSPDVPKVGQFQFCHFCLQWRTCSSFWQSRISTQLFLNSISNESILFSHQLSHPYILQEYLRDIVDLVSVQSNKVSIAIEWVVTLLESLAFNLQTTKYSKLKHDKTRYTCINKWKGWSFVEKWDVFIASKYFLTKFSLILKEKSIA